MIDILLYHPLFYKILYMLYQYIQFYLKCSSKGLDTRLLGKGFKERHDKSEWIYIDNLLRFNKIVQWFQDKEWSSKQRTIENVAVLVDLVESIKLS